MRGRSGYVNHKELCVLAGSNFERNFKENNEGLTQLKLEFDENFNENEENLLCLLEEDKSNTDGEKKKIKKKSFFKIVAVEPYDGITF